MSEHDLQDLVTQLQEQVKRLSNDDEKRQLQNLVGDLEKKLEQPGDNEHHLSVVDSLTESIEHFEAEHPKATGVLNKIMVALSNLGI